MDFNLTLTRKGGLDIDEVEKLIREENDLDYDWNIDIDINGLTLEWTASKNVSASIDDDDLILHAVTSNQLLQDDFDNSDIEVDL